MSRSRGREGQCRIVTQRVRAARPRVPQFGGAGRQRPGVIPTPAAPAPPSIVLTFSQMADAVAHSVILELLAEAEERCGPEQAICEWAMEAGDLDIEVLAALISGLTAQALAAVTITRDDRPKAGAVA